MENSVIHRQHGLWDSPISALSMARGLDFSDLAWSEDGVLAWREMRSDMGVIMLQGPAGDAPRDLNNDYSVRARVGYGGGDFTLGHGFVYFAEADSGRLYRQPLQHGQALPVTPAFGNFASPCLSPDGRWLCFVHTYEDRDSLGIIDAAGKEWPRKLVGGDDFYMQPAWHPAGDRIAWIAWDQPNMPWDGTYLRLGQLRIVDGDLPRMESVETIAGDEGTSIFQPLFAPSGRYLAYCSDSTGWWQLYLYDLERGQHRQLTNTTDSDHALPAWVQGMRTYGFSPDGERLLFIRNWQGFASLWQLHLESGREEELILEGQFTWVDQIAVAPQYGPHGGLRIALIASGSASPLKVISVDVPGRETRVGKAIAVQVRRRASAEELSPDTYSPIQSLSWAGADGGQVHGLFFPPHNAAFEGSGAPPLIVRVHGGPTSQVRAYFNPPAQFFATRGYAFLEVNHRGSTGYGRPYWQALYGNWGLYDVEDAISGVRNLADQGLVDGRRAVIMGGSAGGFTVLQALVDHPGFFKAGVCLYGVANQFTLAADTHKFEARYLDKMLGPLPEAADLYRQRSPLFHSDRIQDPVIIFQGEDDQVVPRAQSDQIVASLQRRGVPHEYHLYPGEGHGFRKSETIEHYYHAVERFLKQYVIFA
jgi:dipeptidyl aminopeptidase/acylaminoacyl peptidase